MKVKQTIALSTKKSHIVISNIIFENGFESERKTAIVAIDPEYDCDEMLEKAKTMSWELNDEADRNGFYRAKPVGELVVED